MSTVQPLSVSSWNGIYLDHYTTSKVLLLEHVTHVFAAGPHITLQTRIPPHTHTHTRTQTHLYRSLSCNSKHGRHEYSYETRSSAVARHHLLNASTFGFDRLDQRSIYGQPPSPNIILKVHFFFFLNIRRVTSTFPLFLRRV